ncbi:MAG: hypothetical protein RL316_1392 [Bacteroidota bacterium]|jgi:hypothetical protein
MISINCFVRLRDVWYVVEQICSESIRIRNLESGFSNWAYVYEIEEVKFN